MIPASRIPPCKLVPFRSRCMTFLWLFTGLLLPLSKWLKKKTKTTLSLTSVHLKCFHSVKKYNFLFSFLWLFCWLNFPLKEVNVPGVPAQCVQVTATFTWIKKSSFRIRRLKSVLMTWLTSVFTHIVRVHQQASRRENSLHVALFKNKCPLMLCASLNFRKGSQFTLSILPAPPPPPPLSTWKDG